MRGFKAGTEAGGRWIENGGPDDDDVNPYRDSQFEYGRRERATGRVVPLSSTPLPDWHDESQDQWEHVQRTVGSWEPVGWVSELFPGTHAALDRLTIRPEAMS